MKMRKCYECGRLMSDKGVIFCGKCVDKPRGQGSSTLIIYDKI